MKINVKHIAKLSRLSVAENQVEKLENEMQSIIELVENLPELNGEINLNPGDSMVLRPDEIGCDKISRDKLLACAPKVKAGCIVVPKTLE